MATHYPNRIEPRQQPQGVSARPPELTNWLNGHIYHPLARLLARALVPTGISPNAVSIAGGLAVGAAGFLYTGLDWPVSVLAGFAAHLSWHVLDGADGDLARMTGRASPAGELIDGVCDYLSHMFLYTLLSIFLFDSIGHWAWPVTLAAGISRIFQANHSESQRRIYLWRVCGIPWLRQAEPANKDVFERSGPVQLLFTGLGQAYVALAEKVSPLSVEVDEAVERASSPRSRERVRRLCRRAGRTSLRLQSWLGANPRTILLGLSMAAGTPLYYFLVELIPLNLLLLWSIRHQKSCNLRLAKQLSGSPLVRSTTRAG